MTDEKQKPKTAKPTVAKPKYDPNGRYVALVTVSHPDGVFSPAEAGENAVTFTMKHRSPEEVEFLVDEIRAIKPAEGKA